MTAEGGAPRPVTAPSGAFEFDLAGGSWSQTFGPMAGQQTRTPKNMDDIRGGRGTAGSETTDFTEDDTLKTAVEEKDAVIEELSKEGDRLREMGGATEGSVVSEMTMEGIVDEI